MVSAWRRSSRFDPRALPLADRHYNRQKIGTPQFVPPGRCVVLLTRDADALWVTSWPFAEYTRHAWGGAWVNSLFRNESPALSSTLIREAVAVTRGVWPDVPTLGMVTFVDADKVRAKRDPGRCYRRAGFRVVGKTKGGLVALQLLPADMPAGAAARKRAMRVARRCRVSLLKSWWSRFLIASHESDQRDLERVAGKALNDLDPHRRRRVLDAFRMAEEAERRRASFALLMQSATQRIADEKAIDDVLASCGIDSESRRMENR